MHLGTYPPSFFWMIFVKDLFGNDGNKSLGGVSVCKESREGSRVRVDLMALILDMSYDIRYDHDDEFVGAGGNM